MIINFKCTYELFGCAGEKKYNSGYRNWQEKSIFIFMEKKEILPNEIHKKQCLVKNIPIYCRLCKFISHISCISEIWTDTKFVI